MKELKNGIEAILFAIGRSVKIKEIAETLNVKYEEVEKLLKELQLEYSDNKGIVILELNDAYQMVSNKESYEYVNAFVINSKKQNLSNTCMEVLSIIAYNPKITKSEIEKIRGVNSDSQVSRLLEYGLVEEVGRLSLPGRPAIFSVTEEFLKCMGIKNIEELPSFSEISTEDEELTMFKDEVQQ